jgi:DNA-binding transcriptional LysR family regulator
LDGPVALDLALIRAFVALIGEQSVSRAAQRLGQSQPQLSAPLRRLRHILRDPILVRGSKGMVATEHALTLMPTAKRMLADGKTLLAPASGLIEPALLRRKFQIALPDFLSAALLARIFVVVRTQAPHCQLAVRPVRSSAEGVELLESGSVDLLIDSEPVSTGHIRQIALFDDPMVVVGARNNAALRQSLSLDGYLRLSHLAASEGSGPAPGIVDRMLLAQGLKRNVMAWVPYLNSTAPVLASTDLVLTTGEALARQLASQEDLLLVKPPITLAPLRYTLMWHERVHRFPEHQWLRALLHATLTSAI